MDEIAETQYNEDITTADLSNQLIASVGNVDDFQSIQSLDLSHNYIQNYDTVRCILQSFPSLTTLILNHNQLQPILSENSFSSSLQVLALSHTSIHINTLLPLLSCLPSLHTLICSSNHMGDVVFNAFHHSSLNTLDLSSNAISNWSVLRSLSSIESLHTLYLSENPLIQSELLFDFPFVSCLDINGLNLSENCQLHSLLSHFPCLTELEVRRNPVYEQQILTREVWNYTS